MAHGPHVRDLPALRLARIGALREVNLHLAQLHREIRGWFLCLDGTTRDHQRPRLPARERIKEEVPPRGKVDHAGDAVARRGPVGDTDKGDVLEAETLG